jgi:hypothetical protein
LRWRDFLQHHGTGGQGMTAGVFSPGQPGMGLRVAIDAATEPTSILIDP